LVVEVDGNVHLDDDIVKRDKARAAWLEKQGVAIFRITAVDMMGDPDGAARDVLELAASRIAVQDGKKA
jgi:very-short-patch-repair endonuclease